jgi:hypothetical protein
MTAWNYVVKMINVLRGAAKEMSYHQYRMLVAAWHSWLVLNLELLLFLGLGCDFVSPSAPPVG